MTRFVLDKNPEEKNSEDFKNILKIFEENNMSSITYSDPFSKLGFFLKLFPSIDIPIIYLDFDLLFSGYVKSGIIQTKNEFTLIQPSKNNWNEIFKEILLKISQKKHLIIIDSLNSLSIMFYDRPDVGRWVNSLILLLVSFAKMSNSLVLSTSLAHHKKEEDWILSITGRLLIDVKNSNKIHLSLLDSKLILEINSKKLQGSIELSIQNSLF